MRIYEFNTNASLRKCEKMIEGERKRLEKILDTNRRHFKWADIASRRFHIEGRGVGERADILPCQDLQWSIQANKFGENVWV